MAATRPAIFEAVVSGQMRLKYYDSAQYHDGVNPRASHKRRMYTRP